MPENNSSRSVIIIGAGIAGLSAGIYAQMNGYQSRIYEMHSLPGGLMTAWKRKGYTIDGCIHWLTGSSQAYPQYYRWWQEIGLIQDREIFNPEIFSRIENKHGQVLNFYADANRLEQHLLELAPEDSRAIKVFCGAICTFSRMPFSAGETWSEKLTFSFKMISVLPQLMHWGKMSMNDLVDTFTNPFLRDSLSKTWLPEMSAVALIFTLAMMHNQGAGYTLGGSLPMALAVEKRYKSLGGEIQYDTRIKRIIVENDRAVGVETEDGRVEQADVVISAADGYNTIFKMLEGRYTNENIKALYSGNQPIFPPILFVGLGVKRTFTELPACTGGFSFPLDEPIQVADKSIESLDTMIYNFDPSLAPQGKTAITVIIPTSYDYWKELYGDGSNREQYDAEKELVAIEIIHRFEKIFPGFTGQVEMADVATPVTFEHYTGNWQGSFEGWIPTPKMVMGKIAKTLPGLANFYMAGQWVQAGGGLPSGLMIGREVVQKICKADGKKFTTRI